MRVKSIAKYDFSALYTKLPHDKLKSKLSDIVDFLFKGGDKTLIRLSNNGTAYWGKKTKAGLGFSKTALKTAINHLMEKCYFNVTTKQAISMGIDPAPFWANPFLYSYEEEYMSPLISSDKIKGRHFHSTKRFIDDICTINDDGEFKRSICEIYPRGVELKFEYQGDQTTFLNLNITIKQGTFLYKLF